MMKHTVKIILISLLAAALLSLCACQNTQDANGSSKGSNTTNSASQTTQSKTGNTTSVATERGELPADPFEEDGASSDSAVSTQAASSKTQSAGAASTASKSTKSSTSPFITGSGENALPIIPLN